MKIKGYPALSRYCKRAQDRLRMDIAYRGFPKPTIADICNRYEWESADVDKWMHENKDILNYKQKPRPSIYKDLLKC